MARLCNTLGYTFGYRRTTCLGHTPPFRNPQLVLTVLEIRYPEIAGGLTDDAVAAMKEAVRDSLPIMATLIEQQVDVAVEVPAPLQVTQRTAPRFMHPSPSDCAGCHARRASPRD